MNHTKNYGLPQWELNDLIKMEDFNGAMNNIESGIDGAMDEAADAKNIANFAKATAAAANQAAGNAYSPANKPYVVGSYTGTGREMPFDLGFRPSFLIISGTTSVFPTGQSIMNSYNLFTAGNVLSNCVTFTDTGFVLHKLEENVYPKLVDGRRYDYIAFR